MTAGYLLDTNHIGHAVTPNCSGRSTTICGGAVVFFPRST